MNMRSALVLIFLTICIFNVGIGGASQSTLTWNNNTAVSYSYADVINEDNVYNFGTTSINIVSSVNLVYSVYTSMPPIIDGSLSLDEWGEPAIIDTLSYTNDSVNYETHDMFVYFMNDNNYLYIAVKITNDDFESESDLNGDWDSLEIWFDGNNNGIIEPGEDIKKFINLIYDDWYYVENYTWCPDTTLDGEGVASHSNQAIGNYTYEFKIPLNSGDAHDMAVTSNSTIGLHIIYYELYYDSIDDCWICNGNDDAWPNNNGQLNGLNYGKLMLNSSSIPVDIEEPTITIFTPANGTNVTTSYITITGTASDASGIASVTVNEALASGSADWSTWSVEVTLTEGANIITAVATDNAGNHNSKTITIYLVPPTTESISIGSAIAVLNSTLTVPVSLAYTENITGFSFDLLYNSSVATVSSVSANANFTGVSITPNIDNINGNTRIVVTDLNIINVSSEAPVLDITFDVIGDLGSSTSLVIQNVEFSDSDFNLYVPGSIVNGKITVVIKGDFNNNGRVDIGDVARVAFMVAAVVQEDWIADFNNNGRVDIGDAAKIAFYLAGKVSEL